MLWEKLGLVYAPDGRHAWARSHAMIPTPLQIDRDRVRVFISCCDEDGIARPGWVDVSASDPTEVLDVGTAPLLEIGQPGTFDENGVLACSVVRDAAGRMLMYYVGFELGHRIRYRLLTGLAISTDGGTTFHRQSTTPILERSASELFFRGGPWCVPDGETYRLWYVAGSSWTGIGGKSMPVYDLRYAESDDPAIWPAQGEVQIEITGADEHGFGRPAVIRKPGGGYRLFYSVRRRSVRAYRLGYAESADGRNWTRLDDALNLDVSASGFDSDAIMYAAPIELNGRLHVFYNGNDFGRDGFAVARLLSE